MTDSADLGDLDDLFAQLSREPDFEAPGLAAHDATDRLLLETAHATGGGTRGGRAARLSDPGALVVVGDRHGALTLGAISVLGARGVRVYQDPVLGERALDANAARIGFTEEYEQYPLDASLLRDAAFVLLQLPRSLAELDELTQAIARWASPDVVLFAGGRVKHMTLAMNQVLGRSFGEVAAGLAQRKSRVLTARAPRPAGELGGARFPVWGRDPDLPFSLAAFGSTFGGATFDHGSRLLLRGLNERGWPEAGRIVDLGCGNGALAVSAALACPAATVIATDQSAGAVSAARLTAGTAGVLNPDGAIGADGPGVQVHRADATEVIPDGWADLILLNPPFHSGAAVHTGIAHRLIRSCARALAPGGELRLVFNSHLGYRPLVERSIGRVRQIDRDRAFTVLSAIRR